MSNQLQQLPLGINSLQKIVDHQMVYIDKTEFAWQLARKPGAYFLSRPRRFGKSLFLDTLHQLFEGNEPLFKGLFIHDKWDWATRYPVIKIDFAGGVLQSREQLDHHIFIIYVYKTTSSAGASLIGFAGQACNLLLEAPV